MREGRGAACCAPTAIVGRGYLLVRVDGKHYGLPLARVLGVGDLGEVLDVPRALAAVRGVTPLRGRLVPLVHLGALLGERPPPAERGRAAVLVQLGAGEGLRQVALEVDDADDVVRETALPVPPGESLPWAAGAAGGHSFPSWTWTRWETASHDQRRRRPTRHLQGGRPGLRLQHLPGRAHPALRGARAAPQGAGLSRGRVAVPGRRGPARRPPQAARHSGPTSRRDAHRHPGMGGREARRRGGRRDREAPGRGDRGHGATEHREGTGGGIHHRDRGEGRAHRHRAQHGAAVQLEGEAGHRERAPGDSETLMVDSPIRALRAEYDKIARKLDTAAAGPEREAVKRDIVAYFKRVDSLIGELGETKEEIRKLVDRYKQLTSSTAEAL